MLRRIILSWASCLIDASLLLYNISLLVGSFRFRPKIQRHFILCFRYRSQYATIRPVPRAHTHAWAASSAHQERRRQANAPWLSKPKSRWFCHCWPASAYFTASPLALPAIVLCAWRLSRQRDARWLTTLPLFINAFSFPLPFHSHGHKTLPIMVWYLFWWALMLWV